MKRNKKTESANIKKENQYREYIIADYECWQLWLEPDKQTEIMAK